MTGWGLKTLFVIIIPALIGIYNGIKNWKAIDDYVRIKTSMFVMVGLAIFSTIFLVAGDLVIGSILIATSVGWCGYVVVACHIIGNLPDEEEMEPTGGNLEDRIKAMKEKNRQ